MTTDATVQPQLDAVLAVVDASLGANVVASYLCGSAVEGGLQRRSDLDVLVVTSRPTTRDERGRLVDGLLPVSDQPDLPGFERPIELTIVVLADIRPWRYPPRMDFQYGEWRRDRLAAGDVEPEKPINPDLAILLTSARSTGRSLAGPPPADLLEPVPPTDLRRALTDELPSLLHDLETDTRNIVLTLARVWVTVATGEIRSKDAAADWALARLPLEHRPVLARARAIYLDEAAEFWDDLRDRLHPFADAIVREIDSA
jgi:streptomycin 3"-adenylyltransferase